MCGATPSGRITTKLGICVRLMDVIKRAKFHQYNLWGFGAVRCWSFHVAIRETQAVLNTLFGGTAPQVLNAFIRRSVLADLPVFEELCILADETLFRSITCNPNHVQYHLLSPQSTASQN